MNLDGIECQHIDVTACTTEGNIYIYIYIYIFKRDRGGSHFGPGVDSASKRNEYQENFLGVKAAIAYG